MINLSQESEALARRLAEAQHTSVEEEVRLAIEARARAYGLGPQAWRPRDTSPEAVAARLASIDRFVEKLSALPVLDARAPNEILDDLYGL